MKNHKINRYILILFLIRNAQNARRPYLTYKFHKDFSPILNILAHYGFILSYNIKANNVVIIWLKGFRGITGVWHPSFSDVCRVPHYKRNPGSISSQLLRRIARNSGGNSLFFLNTDRGIMSHLDAIRFNIGGKLLFKIT